MNKFPLMRNNISREDLDAVIELLKQDDPILTNGPYVKKFEEEWARWLGVNHAVFVNSGSSANLLSMTILKLQYPQGGEVIVPPLTWVSDIASVLQTGFKPVFADINPSTLGMDTKNILKKITDKTRAVFLTHVQGFNALTDELLEELQRKNILLIEDVCESHGATHNNQKLGSFGIMSNFSFYYAHHMSTIEGGMVCTNDPEIYQELRMLRSHGMVRETTVNLLKEHFITEHPSLNPDFIFAFPAYNFRNTEIGGVLGCQQLNRLDSNIEKRCENHELFLSLLDPTHYRTEFNTKGSSNYAFNLILKKEDDALMERLTALLQKNGIEFRRGSAGGGNQLMQPYLQDLRNAEDFPETDHVHYYGMYIGNYPDLTSEEVKEICSVINAA